MDFRSINGWEGIYSVNKMGEVCSIPRVILKRDGTKQSIKGRMMKRYLNSSGYLVVRLSNDSIGRRKVALVHRLVAEAFIPNPKKKPEVNHIDGDKTNPAITNLEWVTPKENRKHAWDTGLRNRGHLPIHIGSQKHNSKLNEQIVYKARKLRDDGYSYMQLARLFSVSKKTIMDAVKGISWSHV